VRESSGSFLDGVLAGMFTVPGDGSLDYGAIMNALVAIGYSGWIVIEAEQDPKLADPKQYAELGLRTLEGARAAAGLALSTLRVRPHARDASGTVLEVTPHSAGWRHVGFRVVKLAPNEQFSGGEPDREPASSSSAARATWRRDRAFADVGGRAIRSSRARRRGLRPGGTRYEVAARDAVELAVCTAPGTTPAGAPDRRGRDVARDARHRHQHALRAQHPAANARGRQPAGGGGDHAGRPLVELSAAQARHVHAEQETALEETYYHRLNPPQGFAFQRVYTDDRSLDETVCVEDGDVVMVPRGYHPVGAPHGYDLYYLNVMAGPRREWIFRNDPSHDWIVPQAERD
jgi:5-deoxy-glucuronate isomerase